MRRILILFFALTLIGCASRERLQARANIVTDTRSDAERAELLGEYITQIEDINKASVVITGNSAIVGIGVEAELDDQKLMRLKSKVEQEVKRQDPRLSHVAVTATLELVERINKLADSIADDAPPETDSELEHIIESLTPPA